MSLTIIKRDGRRVDYNPVKIQVAVQLALSNNLYENVEDLAEKVTINVDNYISNNYKDFDCITVEEIQDLIISQLNDLGYSDIAKSYTNYRNERTLQREKKSNVMKTMKQLDNDKLSVSDIKRENGNINGDTAMGTMLKYGSTTSKEYYLNCVLDPKFSNAHRNGDIHIHDLDFYTLTTTCCQIDIKKLLSTGFSTGHGHLRSPSNIISASALTCIAIQSNQNDQHGGQSIPNFDYGLAPYVAKSFIKNIWEIIEICCLSVDELEHIKKELISNLENYYDKAHTIINISLETFNKIIGYDVLTLINTCHVDMTYVLRKAKHLTIKDCYQAMEALIHNLNTMNSRAGAQVPFSSLNFGTDTSAEGRLVIESLLKAQEAGLGNGETPIFPITIFKVKEGVNYNKEDPNYDLFKMACRVSAKRLFPNFSFIDAPFNLPYYKEGDYNTEIAYMGCIDYNEKLYLDGHINSNLSIGKLYDEINWLYNNKSKILNLIEEDGE